MKKIGLLKGMGLCSQYDKMSIDEKKRIQEERLKDIVSYAKANSPYYSELYKNVNTKNFKLSELPPVNKLELMKHFDTWLTDRKITLSQVQEFMLDLDNIGRKLQDKYLVFTTSGSTGNPLVALYDQTANNVMSAISVNRAYARKEDLTKFIKKGHRTIGVFATGGFYLSNGSVRARLLKMPWKKRQMAVTSALLPVKEIVKQLNAFNPTMLGGYPSNLELLIEEQKSGRLHISPVIIMTGGEYLSDKLRQALAETFQCYVQTSYGCTEGGTVACECEYQHFHINEDWVIVEPVDKDNQPVADGVLADKLLLTNLFNFTQPYIRYEITDRIIMHHEGCACGKTSPWIEIEGRTDDVTTFYEAEKEVKVAPLAIYAVLKEVHELKRFQVLVYPKNKVELRLEVLGSMEIESAFEKAKEVLTQFLISQGISKVEINLSMETPKQHAISGKFKHIICVKEQKEAGTIQ